MKFNNKDQGDISQTMSNGYSLLNFLAGKMMSKWAKNVEKNKIPNLTYVFLQNTKYLIACPRTGGVDPYAASISPSVVLAAFTAVRISITAEESQLFLHTPQLSHQKTQRKLKSSSSSPNMFCTVLQSISISLWQIRKIPVFSVDLTKRCFV